MNSSYYRTRYTYDSKRNKMWKEIASYLQRFIIPSAKIIDIGAGYCDFINNIRAKEKHAVDIEKNLEKHANSDVITHNNNSFELKNIQDNYFDVVFMSNLLEHLSQDELKKTILEVKRILKKGGKLLILQPNYYYCYRSYFDDFTHRTIFSHHSLADFLTSFEFEIEKIYPKFLPFSFKSSLPKIPILLRIYLRSPIKPLAKQMFLIALKK